MSHNILVVEDDPDIAHLVGLHLEDLPAQVTTRADGLAGLEAAQGGAFDLVILDLRLPGLDGLEVCRRLRTADTYVPILMLTAKSSELDRVCGLDIGADDYLTKPFSIPELVARVKAILRRAEAMASPREEGDSRVQAGELMVNRERREVTLAGRPVELTSKEFDLLWFFASHPGRVYSRAQLLDAVWGWSYEGYEHTVSSHINRLRTKLEADPGEPRYVLTVWGVGYKFAAEP